MRFRLTSRSMTVDDLALLWIQIFAEFRWISQIWEPTATKSEVQVTLISQDVPPLGGVKQGWGAANQLWSN